jgi:hypothetical protein
MPGKSELGQQAQGSGDVPSGNNHNTQITANKAGNDGNDVTNVPDVTRGSSQGVLAALADSS